MDNKMTKRIIGAFVAIILVAAVVLAVYFAMNREDSCERFGTEVSGNANGGFKVVLAYQ